MALDMTTFAPALKTVYTKKKIENLTLTNNPLLAMLEKYTSFGGDSMKIPLIYGNPQGRAAAFATAQSNLTNSKLKAFFITRAADYSVAQIDNQTIMASEGDSNAFLKAVTVETDGALNSLARSLAIALYRSGTGTVCQVSSAQSGSSTTITLSNADDAMNIEVDQALVASSTDGGAASSTPYFVTSVNRIAGTFTCAATVGGTAVTATTAGFTASKYLSIQGDLNAKLTGLAGWCPSTAPTAGDSFFQVDRSADSRLYGQYIDKTNVPLEEAAIDVSAMLAKFGAAPSHWFMNPTDWANLVKMLGSKVQYVNISAGSEGQIGFQGVRVAGAKRPIDVIPDFNCPSGDSWMLQLDTWTLASLGEAPALFRGDGLDMIRAATADALQLRCFYYAQLACSAPGYNARVKLR